MLFRSLDAYPTLRAQDLANAWAYVHAHREQIERQIADNESDEDVAADEGPGR